MLSFEGFRKRKNYACARTTGSGRGGSQCNRFPRIRQCVIYHRSAFTGRWRYSRPLSTMNKCIGLLNILLRDETKKKHDNWKLCWSLLFYEISFIHLCVSREMHVILSHHIWIYNSDVDVFADEFWVIHCTCFSADGVEMTRLRCVSIKVSYIELI
jgi:hypothetical protein